MMRSTPFFVALTFVLASACGTAPSTSAPGEEIARSTAPIINGVPSGPEDDAAVALANLPPGGGFSGACSGVLVSPKIVLTARHCVARTQDGGIACTRDGKPLAGGNVISDYPASNLAVLTGSSIDLNKLRNAPRGVKILHTGAKNLCNNDIALVILGTAVTDAPIAQLRLDAPPVKGDKILAVGWGQSNNSSGYGRRRRADIPIVTVGPAGSSTGGGVGPAEFQIGEGICSGDSGGPAFDMTTKAVVGVVSRGGNGYPATADDPPWIQCVDQGGYRTFNLYTRVDSYKDLILQAFAETGEEPWLEGQPDPRKKKFGEACAGANECRSDLCIHGSNGPVCTQKCSDETPCPEAHECVDVEGTKVCAPKAAAPAAEATPRSKGCATSTRAPLGAPTFALGLAAIGLAAVRRRRR